MKLVMSFVIALVLTVALFAQDIVKPKVLDEKIEQQIDVALQMMNMTRQDLLFDRAKVKDPYRLKITTKLLADPLAVPVYMETVSEQVAERSQSLQESFLTAGESLDWGQLAEQSYKPALALNEQLKTVLAANYDAEMAEKMPEPLQLAISNILRGAELSDKLMQDAFVNFTPEDREIMLVILPQDIIVGNAGRPLIDSLYETDKDMTQPLLDIQDKVDMAKIQQAADVMAHYVDQARSALANLSLQQVIAIQPSKQDDANGNLVFSVNTSLGKLVVGGVGDNIHDSGATFIIDLAGNDTYRGRVGAAVGLAGQFVSVCIDYGGNDYYQSSKQVTQGSGFMGIGILVDENGDDRYDATNFSQGSGVLGVGLLFDGQGNDRYNATSMTQGAGCFGAGFLLDKGGDDNYTAEACCQAFGYVKGLGVLYDQDGNDYYLARGHFDGRGRYHCMAQGFGWGWRPTASGGVGILVDGGGNDHYNAIYYAQGCSYWFAVGVLIDNAGNDRYDSQVYGQGCGIHLSVGGLLERGGSDTYISVYGGNQQGASHDWAVGVLIDEGGNDMYIASGNAHGSAITNGVAIFIDKAGADHYYQISKSHPGFGGKSRGSGSIGIFIDLAGDDSYASNSNELDVGNGKMWTRGAFGAGIDVSPESK